MSTHTSLLPTENLNFNLQHIPATQILTLPSGKMITAESFITDPIFKSTNEKNEVFEDLTKLCASNEAILGYQQFLHNLHNSDWHSNFKNDSKKLAYFAIIAYLDDKIDKMELFTIHTVADAYHELDNHGIAELTIGTLTEKNAAGYLKETGFVPFAPRPYPQSPQIRNCKSDELLEKEKHEFLVNLNQLSSIKRTYVAYTLRPFREKQSVETGMYSIQGCRIGYKNVSQPEKGTVVLLSPEVSIDLLRRTSSVASVPYDAHEYIFGYSSDDTPFYKGIRVISIPSPLFVTPHVHEFCFGPKGLGLYHHDISYHMPLDINNPHIMNICRIAQKLLAYTKTENQCPPNWIERCKNIASMLVDRETRSYRYAPPDKATFHLHMIHEVYINSGDRAEFQKLKVKVIDPWIEEEEKIISSSET